MLWFQPSLFGCQKLFSIPCSNGTHLQQTILTIIIISFNATPWSCTTIWLYRHRFGCRWQYRGKWGRFRWIEVFKYYCVYREYVAIKFGWVFSRTCWISFISFQPQTTVTHFDTWADTNMLQHQKRVRALTTQYEACSMRCSRIYHRQAVHVHIR